MTRQQLDELLVDYLYDELDGTTRTSFEAALTDHPDIEAEVSALQATRGEFADHVMAQPPQPVLDQIMRAARMHAQVAPVPSFWDRLVSLVMQPAVAMAMVATLVAGVAIFAGTGQQSSRDSALDGPVAVISADEPASAAAAPEMAEPATAAAAVDEATAVPDLELASASGAIGSQGMAEAPAVEPAPAAVEVDAPAELVGPDPELAVAKASVPKAAKKRSASSKSDRDTMDFTFVGDTTKPADQAAKQQASPIQIASASRSKGDASGQPYMFADKAGASAAAAEPAPSPAAAKPAAQSEDSKADDDAAKPPGGIDLVEKYDAYLRKARYSDAHEVLDELARLPGWEKEAQDMRRRLSDAQEKKSAEQTVKQPAKKKQSKAKSVDYK